MILILIKFARDDFAKAHGQIKSAVSEILESESLKTTKRISIDTFTSSRFESDSESFTSRGEYDESETEIEQNTQPETGRCSSPKKVSPAIKIPLVMDNEEGFLKVTKPTRAM